MTPMDTLVNAAKRTLLRYKTPTYSSTSVKLVDGIGPVLEVKRNGTPMKKWYPTLGHWVKTLPPAPNGTPAGKLIVHLPPAPTKTRPQMR
jgi:hypothetical protein